MKTALKVLVVVMMGFTAMAIIAQNSGPGQVISSPPNDTSLGQGDGRFEVEEQATPMSGGGENINRTNTGGGAVTQDGNAQTGGAVPSDPEVEGLIAAGERESGTMGTIYAAVALFGLGAILGMYLLSVVFRNRETPKMAAVVHGLFAVIGLILLIVYSTKYPGPVAAIVIFAIAALGGIVMFYTDITGKPVPKWLGVAHGVTALSGFVALLVFAF